MVHAGSGDTVASTLAVPNNPVTPRRDAWSDGPGEHAGTIEYNDENEAHARDACDAIGWIIRELLSAKEQLAGLCEHIGRSWGIDARTTRVMQEQQAELEARVLDDAD